MIWIETQKQLPPFREFVVLYTGEIRTKNIPYEVGFLDRGIDNTLIWTTTRGSFTLKTYKYWMKELLETPEGKLIITNP